MSMTTVTSPDSRRVARASRFSRFTTQPLTNCTSVDPSPIRAALAIRGRPAKKPPVFPMLLGISIPLGVRAWAVADGEWLITLSRMTS